MKKLILFLFLYVFLIPNINAADAYLNCPSSGALNSTLSCTLTASVSSDKVSSLSATVRVSNNLKFKSFTPALGWQGDGKDGKIDLYTDINVTGTFSIGTIVFSVNSETPPVGTVTVNSILFSSGTFEEYVVPTVSKNINILSNINTLSSLSISNGNLSPAFNSNTLSYTATVNSPSTFISFSTTNSASVVSGDIGNKTLKYGENKFYIYVKSASGETRTYTIAITRPDGRNSNANLKSLTVSNTDIKFDNTKTSYISTVENDIDKIVINAQASANKSSITGTGTFDLKIGINKFYVTVTAENTLKKAYSITVIRKGTDATDDFKGLKSLSIKDYDLSFSSDKYNYKIEVFNDITEMEFSYETLNKDDIVEISGNKNLKMGNNEINIKVVSALGIEKKYTISVVKKEFETKVDNDTTKIIDAINSKSKNINVYIKNTHKDKLIYSDIIEALISNKLSIRYNVIDDLDNILYYIDIDGSKIEKFDDYIDIELMLKKEKDKLNIEFNKHESLPYDIKLYINTNNYFKENKLYLYNDVDNLKYIKEIKVKDNFASLSISSLSSYILSVSKIYNTVFYLYIFGLLILLGGITFLMIKLIKSKYKKVVE